MCGGGGGGGGGGVGGGGGRGFPTKPVCSVQLIGVPSLALPTLSLFWSW